jgi:hypothetical protein
MKYLLYIILLLLLASCGQRFHVKRAEFHLRKAQEKGAQVNLDTTVREVKLKIEGVKVRFIPKPIFLNGDTVYFEDKGVSTKIVARRDSAGNTTVAATTKCPDKEIVYNDRTITKTVTAVKSTWLKWWMLLIAAAAGALLGILKR